jgi:hypothetical protein
MLELGCDCGARLFVFGDDDQGAPPWGMMDQFRDRLDGETVVFFSSADGEYGHCVHCDTTIELPPPEVMQWLPYMDQESFHQALTYMQMEV